MKQLLIVLILSSVDVSMMQGSEPHTTVIIAEKNGVTKYITINDSELNSDALLDKVSNAFERGSYGTTNPKERK